MGTENIKQNNVNNDSLFYRGLTILSMFGITSAVLFGSCEIRQFGGDKIESKQKLEEVVSLEKSKLDCDQINIKSYIIDDEMNLKKYNGACSVACSFKMNNKDTSTNDFAILVNNKYVKTATVRHEVYHICAGHFSDNHKYPFGRFLFKAWTEPSAKIYTAWGVKL